MEVALGFRWPCREPRAFPMALPACLPHAYGEVPKLSPWAFAPAAAAVVTASIPVALRRAGVSFESFRSMGTWRRSSGAITGPRAHRGYR
jgi:hypothetical protein